MRIVIAEDQGIMITGLKLILASSPGFVVVGEARDGFEAIRVTADLRPDVVILDLAMPRLDGIQALKAIRRRCPDTRVLIFTGIVSGHHLKDVMDLGAMGYVLKEGAGSELLMALRAISVGRQYISPDVAVLVSRTSGGSSETSHITDREKQVLKLLAEGYTNQEIASLLNISVKTVERHRENLTRKLNVRNPVGLAAVAIREGLVAQSTLAS
jgi:two-component system, NarL family, response regulator NreC